MVQPNNGGNQMKEYGCSNKGVLEGKGGVRFRFVLLAVVASVGAYGTAGAFEIPTGNDDIQWRWDNTLRYTLSQRVKGQNNAIINNANIDDGDRNFDVGIVSNRLDLLSEMDLVYKNNYGVRFSGAGWYDQRYRQHLDNSSPFTSNHLANGQPTTGLNNYADRYFAGPSGELLDAFTFGIFTIGDIPINVKVGRHTVYWGESMLGNGGTHGIAYAQSAIDIAKGLGTPGVEMKELFRPRNQVSAQAQLTNELSVAGQYYLQYEHNRHPATGTYLSFLDFLGNGGESMIVGGPTPAGLPRAGNAGDIDPRQARDWGVSVRWSPAWLAGTLGFYYRNFTDVEGQLHLNLSMIPEVGPVPTSYQWAYPTGIELYGISLSKQVAGISIGSELSYRRNMPLLSEAAPILTFAGQSAPGAGDTLGARGDTWHALVNTLYIFSKSPLYDTATGIAELTWNRWSHVTQHGELFKGRDDYANKSFDGVSKDYFGGAVNFTPTWFQVIPGVDLSMPLSASMGLSGYSAVTAGGNKNCGTYGLGFGADIFQKYKAELKYVGFFGPYENRANAEYSSLKDRDMVTLTLKTSF